MLETKPSPRLTFHLPRFSARDLLTSTAAIMGGILVAVLAAGGSYALWNGSAEIPDVSVASGTVGLTVEAIPDLNVGLLVPGTSVYTAFTASNTGNADLAVVMSGTTIPDTELTQNLTLTLAVVSDSSFCSTSVADGVSGPAIGFTSTAPVMIDAGASTEYCLVVTLDSNAPDTVQDSTASFTLTFDGVQI